MANGKIIILTPSSIPEYAKETGRSEESLLSEYYEALGRNQIFYGYVEKM